MAERGVRSEASPRTADNFATVLQRASWALHRDCPRLSDVAEAAFTGARRADRCVTQVDRRFSLDAQRHRCPTMSVDRRPSAGPLEWPAGTRNSAWPVRAHCASSGKMRRRASPRHRKGNRPATQGRCDDSNRSKHSSVVAQKSRASRDHTGREVNKEGNKSEILWWEKEKK